MGARDVELFRSWVDRSADLGSARAWIDFWHEHAWAEDMDHRAVEGAADDVGPIIGRDAMRRYVADWDEMFDDLRFAVEEVWDAGDRQAIARWHMSGRAKASGVPTELRFCVAYWLRDARIARSREFWTREEAEAALADG